MLAVVQKEKHFAAEARVSQMAAFEKRRQASALEGRHAKQKIEADLAMASLLEEEEQERVALAAQKAKKARKKDK